MLWSLVIRRFRKSDEIRPAASTPLLHHRERRNPQPGRAHRGEGDFLGGFGGLHRAGRGPAVVRILPPMELE